MKLEELKEAANKHIGNVAMFKLENIGREEPTDFPPIHEEKFPTSKPDLKSWMVEYFTDENGMTEEEAKKEVNSSKFEKGADGALYRKEDNDGAVLVRYSFK